MKKWKIMCEHFYPYRIIQSCYNKVYNCGKGPNALYSNTKSFIRKRFKIVKETQKYPYLYRKKDVIDISVKKLKVENHIVIL